MLTNPHEPPKVDPEQPSRGSGLVRAVLLFGIASGVAYGAWAFYATLWIPPPPGGELKFRGLPGAIAMSLGYFCVGSAAGLLLAAPIGVIIAAIRWSIGRKARLLNSP